MTEGNDKRCLGLNCSQSDGVDRDELIEVVAGANPRTVVVLQSGGPVLTPWRDAGPGDPRGLVSGPERRHRDRARPVRQGRAHRAPAGDVPGARGGPAHRRRLREVPGHLRDRPLQGGRPRRLPLVRRAPPARRLPVRPRPLLHALPAARPADRGPPRRPRRRPGERGGSQRRRPPRVRGAAALRRHARARRARPAAVASSRASGRSAFGPGAAKRVRFRLGRRAFSYWDTPADRWKVAPGCYRIAVGESSRDLPLRERICR